VVTNARCFMLRTTSFAGPVRVTDLQAVPDDAGLSPDDVIRLHEGLAALGERAARAPALEAKAARSRRPLPPQAVERVHAALEPGETLLWASLPTVREHLLHAPVDALTTTAGAAGAALAGWGVAEILGFLSHSVAFADPARGAVSVAAACCLA